ncbi:MAG: DUF4249 domain-containing protein [Bacteroidales bacterium]|nr:DUF4249 domain-containing protein [Bacteroidales bacterium]MDD4813813.1 DUF4249 domain-containing protein [Bacteroidales bacterium]
MLINSNIRVFCSFALLVITSMTYSCRTKIPIEFPDFKSLPVLNSFLVADSVIRVHLSMADALDTVPLPLVENATVSFYVNDTFTGNLYPAGNGYYETDVRAREGNIYRFEAEIPDFPTVSAQDSIPESVPLLSIEHILKAGVDDEGHTFPAVKITIPVNTQKIKYLHVLARLNKNEGQWKDWQLKDFHDPVLVAEGLPIAVFSTELIQDTIYTMQIDYSTGGWRCLGDSCWMPLYPFVIELKSISYAYYQYLKQLYLYNSGRYPDFQFAPYKAFPLFSNVNNGMGVVAGYSSYLSDVVNP